MLAGTESIIETRTTVMQSKINKIFALSYVYTFLMPISYNVFSLTAGLPAIKRPL